MVQSAPKAKTCSILPALLEAAPTPQASYLVVGRNAEIGNEAAAHYLALDPYYEGAGWVRIREPPEALALFFMHKHIFRAVFGGFADGFRRDGRGVEREPVVGNRERADSFIGGLLGDSGNDPDDTSPHSSEPEDFPWHDPGLPLDERMALAAGRRH